MKAKLFICVVLFSVAFLPSSLFAQAGQVDLYGGYFWPADNDAVGKFRGSQMLGVQVGGYVTEAVQLSGNFAWINHFTPKNDNLAANLSGDLGFPRNNVRAWIWEPQLTYNFATNKLGANVVPYASISLGGLTTRIVDGSESVLVPTAVNTPSGIVFLPRFTLNDGDTFLTFSYGGGVKALSVFGPVGFFGDFRGRSIPNFFGEWTNWPELKAGVTFSWGER